ncbi:hypothetical protein BJV78DRAFT_1245876 [Lactifluus subvellereus]|nr:hypothetical protein BJV78DRAFT_1245876 [Lactifluus subvellereus]
MYTCRSTRAAVKETIIILIMPIHNIILMDYLSSLHSHPIETMVSSTFLGSRRQIRHIPPMSVYRANTRTQSLNTNTPRVHPNPPLVHPIPFRCSTSHAHSCV